jgi:phosphohistidine swiveling domain-containing protein
MSDIVRTFDTLTKEQQALAGGKGGTLSRLYQARYPVPDGFVILPTAFAGNELTPEAWAQVSAHLTRLRADRNYVAFAVRSSALSEDSAQASFAGEFETVLDVYTDQDVREAIHRVRHSRHSPRVKAYSQAQGMQTAHEMAVVIQRLVRADISGVLFTADPITGSQAILTGNFVLGLGDQLVSGESSGRAFTIRRPYAQYQGPSELQPFARRLYRLAHRLQKDLGCPQDIEWAIAGGRLYLLQSRPITTLRGYNPTTGEWNASLSGDFLWSSVNFGEAVPEVMTPLSWSVLRLILDKWIFLPGYHPTGNIGGRPYLNISLFATLLHAMGKNKQSILQAMEGTVYTRLPEEAEIPLLPVSRLSVLFNLPQFLRVQRKQRTAVKALPEYLTANPARCATMQHQIQQAATQSELIALWHDMIRPHITETVWAVLGSASHSSDYTIPLRRKLTKWVGPDDADALISNLSPSSDLLASLGPLVGLAKVARGEMTRDAYLESYGHRGPHEFELSIPRPAEDPEWLDQHLARFKASPVDVEALLTKQHAEFEAAWDRFRTRYARHAKSIQHRIREAARRARLRESARSEYVRDRSLARAFALRAGELTDLGNDIFFLTIDEVLDVLAGDGQTITYIPARRETYQKYKALPPYPSLIRGRFDPFQWAADPQRRSDFFDSSIPLPASISDADALNKLFGSPGSAGRIQGLVRRLERPEDGHLLQHGEVLVAKQTDIAWTLLFPHAAAIVTDVGAPLSHAAIVARELGIPAVVGCGDATMRLKTGDRVLVDGGRGVVEVLVSN